MEFQEEIQRRLAKINSELEARDDSARIAFVSIEPDPDFDDEWLLLLTWQLADDEGQEGWPLELLDRYCDLASDRLQDLGSTECLFRTTEELRDGAPAGAPLQVA